METFSEFLSTQSDKPWSATKKEIVTMWRNLQPNLPLMPRPIPKNSEGSTYGYDAIRITGSSDFIKSILSRFKDFLYKETPDTKLGLVFRQTQGKHGHDPNQNKYVCYISVIERAKHKKGFTQI